MKLPFRENAYIPEGKLTEYLLSETHPVGSSKAKFFRRLGFDETNVDKLAKSLLRIAKTNDVNETIEFVYGINYVIEGIIKTPSRKTGNIKKTVWFTKTPESSPSFVTAYPV